MMKPPKSIMTTFLVLLFAGHVHLNSVNIHPERATGIVGQEAHINCEVEFGKSYDMNWDFNNKFVYFITNEVEEYPVGKSKYSVQRAGKNFTLIIKNLNLEDGGKYICSSFTSEATAFLLVLDTPSITLYPPKPIEGQAVEVTCEARFRGPREDLILPNHFPNLTMYLNGSSLNEMHTAETNNNVKEYHLITLTKNFTVHAKMNTRQITCESGTAEPLTNISGTTVMNVLYSVRNIYVTPKQEIFDVGDHITCIADSNPEAVYVWNEVQGGSLLFGNQLNITATMIGENNWKCFARNVINGEWFEEIVQAHFVAVDPSKSGNDISPVTIAVVTVIIILLVIFAAAFFFRKKILTIYQKRSRTHVNANNLQELGLAEANNLFVDKPKALNLGPLECIQLLKSAWDKHELDQHGKKILRVLKEDRTSILENYPNILIVLIKKVGDLIDSEYYEDIIKVAPHGGTDSPLKYLNQLMKDKESFENLFKDQKKLLSVIQIISSYGDVQYRTECLRYIIITKKFSGNYYTFEWSEEYLSTLKELLEKGADPTWIHPEDLEKERIWEYRSTAQTEFFLNIFVNLWEKNDLHESLLQVLPLMLSWKCKDNELLCGTLLHRFVEPRCWDYIATNRGSMPPDFFRQFQNILREILRQDGTLLVQKDCDGQTPLQLFLKGIKLEESIFGEVREIIQMLQTPEVLSSQDDFGWTALHYLALNFPVIRGEVSQSGRESILDLVKSFANESNVGCQDKALGQTALHVLAWKFSGGISEEWREVYQDFVEHLATYDIHEIKDIFGFPALHYLADRFTETLKTLKCLAVSNKDKDGDTALEMISRSCGKKVPEHYKNKFQEISDIFSGNE